MKVILWYDTNCNLCKRYVLFIKRRDKNSLTDFRSIYEKTGQINGHGITSIIIEVDSREYAYSTAILKHFVMLGGYLRILGFLGLAVPRIIRDPVYRFVANNRYAWFGKCD
jgi:predicted DCC family thiol-disulfide oxidoreductase YuxK